MRRVKRKGQKSTFMIVAKILIYIKVIQKKKLQSM